MMIYDEAGEKSNNEFTEKVIKKIKAMRDQRKEQTLSIKGSTKRGMSDCATKVREDY